MNTPQQPILFQETDNQSSLVTIFQKCFHVFLKFWPWFLASALVCLLIGFIYQQRKPRVFQRQSVILIEDAEETGGLSKTRRRGANTALLELNGISVSGSLNNEMFVLTSRRLMENVVRNLHLDVDYTTTRAMHTVALYTTRPFTVQFDQEEKHSSAMDVKMEDDGTFTLSNFRRSSAAGEEAKNSDPIRVKAGQHVQTPCGGLTIVPTPEAANFGSSKNIHVTHVAPKIAAKEYSAKVQASEYDKESTLIVITCSDINARRSEDILRGIFEAYKRDVVENKNHVAQHTAKFIDERIGIIGEELSRVENQMASLKQRNGVIDFTSAASTLASETASARHATTEMETQLSVAQYLYDYVQKAATPKEVIPTVGNFGNTSIASQVGEYNKLLLERNRMSENSSENTPAIRDLDKQLTALRGAILSSLKSYVNSTKLQLSHARSNESELQGMTAAVPQHERLGLDIARQQTLKENLYTYLLNKREEVALQLAINEANVRMVEEPIGAAGPVSPRTTTILLISLLIGLAIPALVLYTINLFDTTISVRQEVEDVVSAPIVGELPHWDTAGKHAIIGKGKAGSNAITEAFRVMRYSLNFMGQNAKVFLVTSSTPGQGKSFVSRNLATVLAMTGKRVILVDADIRKHTSSHVFGQSEGLTGYLIDENNTLSLDKIILSDAVASGVDFLPAGVVPPNPAELLMSPRFDQLIDALRSRYDYVLVDTTPMLSVADANIISRTVDLTLFVLRVGVQARTFLPDLEKMYKENK
ncbi:MAG: polysaccharide biosynthesis tyrosine autokinase, partial [Bacteroidales bacterium]|nr:polysaccharide biosynthesis tyrosine autokinase [Candidatus Equimonas enterica]